LGAEIVDDLLGCVGEDLFELETPLILLMVDDTCLERPFDMNVD